MFGVCLLSASLSAIVAGQPTTETALPDRPTAKKTRAEGAPSDLSVDFYAGALINAMFVPGQSQAHGRVHHIVGLELGWTLLPQRLEFLGEAIASSRLSDALIDVASDDEAAPANITLTQDDTLELLGALRYRLPSLGFNTTPYIKAQLGFVGGDQTGGNHFVGLGIEISNGPWVSSSLEAGWGVSSFYDDGHALDRFKIGASLSYQLFSWASPFFEVYVDSAPFGGTTAMQFWAGVSIPIVTVISALPGWISKWQHP